MVRFANTPHCLQPNEQPPQTFYSTFYPTLGVSWASREQELVSTWTEAEADEEKRQLHSAGRQTVQLEVDKPPVSFGCER